MREEFPASRSYSKIFLGNFFSEDSRDILLWRKLYKSRTRADELRGFKLLGEKFVHYQLKDGRYLQQETEQEQIKTWLAENELTW